MDLDISDRASYMDNVGIGPSHSIDWSGLQHRRRNRGWMGKGPYPIMNNDDGNNDDDSSVFLGCSKRTSAKETVMTVPSFDSVASEVELYYDSDPGPEGNDNMSKPRNSSGKKNQRMIDADMKGEKQRGAGSSPASSPSMGLLQTYDVPSFDIHDIHKVSQLIAVRIILRLLIIHEATLYYSSERID